MITYTKLNDGSWGIRSTVPLKEGQTVSVTRKDGTSRRETVGKIIWQGNGVTLATIYCTARKETTNVTTTARSSSSRARTCAECGKGGHLVRDMEDGRMKHRDCCDM